MNKFLWWCFVIRLSLRWVPRLNLGDEVIYGGKRWTLIQGVCDPVWSLVRDGERIDVHRDEFRKYRGPLADWRSFKSGYRFYMGYWYGIWIREGVKPWMLGCAIWAGKPPSL